MVWHAYAIGAGITARCWHSRFFPHQTCPPIDTSMWLLWPSRGPIDTTQNTCHCDNMRTFLQRLTDCDRVIAIMIRIAFLHEKFQPKKIGDLMQSCSNCLRLFQVNPDPNQNLCGTLKPYAIGAGITARCWHSRRCWHQTCPPIDISTPPHWSKIAPSKPLHIALEAGSSRNGPLCNTHWSRPLDFPGSDSGGTTKHIQTQFDDSCFSIMLQLLIITYHPKSLGLTKWLVWRNTISSQAIPNHILQNG